MRFGRKKALAGQSADTTEPAKTGPQAGQNVRHLAGPRHIGQSSPRVSRQQETNINETIPK